MGSISISSPIRQKYPAAILSTVWTAAGLGLYLIDPLVAPAMVPLSIIAPLAWYWIDQRQLPWFRPSAVTLALVAIAIYLALNATWSMSPSDAYRSVFLIFIIAGSLHLSLNTLQELRPTALRSMGIGCLAGMLVGAVFLCLELWDGQAIRRLAMSLFPALQPNPHHMKSTADQITYLAPHLLNQNMAVLTLLFWPAILIGIRVAPERQRRLLVLGCVVLTAATVLRSVHATSKIALIGSAILFGIFQVTPSLGKRLTAIVFAAATALVVPLALLAYANNLFSAGWLPASAQQRIVIWGYTAEQIGKAPAFGAGIATARATNDYRDVSRAPGTDFPLSTGHHSHNGYLQVWYETGAFGALMLLGFGLLLLSSLSSRPADAQPYLYSAFAACALMAASSFSIWQPWFLASLALTAAFATLGAALPARDEV